LCFGPIAGDVGRFIAAYHGLDVEKISVFPGIIHQAVADPRDGATLGLLPQGLEGTILEIDADLHVDAELAQGVAQVFVGKFQVAARIGHHDITAARRTIS